MRALIVDDSRAVRSVIGRNVRELGFAAFEAGNGRDALQVLETEGAMELALVDWNMPEMSGYDFVCAVRANAAHSAMRIIMVTSESEVQRVVSALEAGANEYLMKPFTVDALRDKLVLTGVLDN
jgi:two-component system chemotaxis response regulator CheY